MNEILLGELVIILILGVIGRDIYKIREILEKEK